MAKSKEDLAARRESLAQLKKQHGIDWLVDRPVDSLQDKQPTLSAGRDLSSPSSLSSTSTSAKSATTATAVADPKTILRKDKHATAGASSEKPRSRVVRFADGIRSTVQSCAWDKNEQTNTPRDQVFTRDCSFSTRVGLCCIGESPNSLIFLFWLSSSFLKWHSGGLFICGNHGDCQRPQLVAVSFIIFICDDMKRSPGTNSSSNSIFRYSFAVWFRRKGQVVMGASGSRCLPGRRSRQTNQNVTPQLFGLEEFLVTWHISEVCDHVFGMVS
jgi:hypothetical protein